MTVAVHNGAAAPVALHHATLPEPQAHVAYVPTDPTGGRLVAWAEALGAAHRLGSALCQTAIAPAHFKGKPEETAAAIMMGDEIGLTPTQALRSIHVISGTPGLYAKAMVALVQSKGHDIWTEEDTPQKVVVCGQRRGSNRVERSEWTYERARKAGYTSNKKYETSPQEMLYARAAGTVCRRVAADALAGLAYTVEEIELDQGPATTTLSRSVTPDEPKRTARRRQPEAPSVPEPALEPEPPQSAPAPASDAGEAITGPQMRKLQALLNSAGKRDRDSRLAFVSEFLGHEVESSSALTKAEAHALIDHLEQQERAGADVADPEDFGGEPQ